MATKEGRSRRVAMTPRCTQPVLLGRDPESAIPVEMAMNGLARKFRTRFPDALWLTGELVQVSRARGGRVFAVLRGGSCRADVHMPPHVARQGEIPSPGAMILVKGALRIREQAGAFRIEAETPLIPTDAAGARAESRRAVMSDLRSEGVFDRARRKIPEWPAEVAVVTSAHGAAIEDIRHVIRRRAPWVRVQLYDCAVQGIGSPASIVKALRAANRSPADLVIVARGGGAADDLDAFDQPQVVREIGGSRLPLIVAVGHEPDSTLSDLAADLSAPTPSAAAECAVPDRDELRGRLASLRERVHTAAWHCLVSGRANLLMKVERGGRAAQRAFVLARERLERRNPERLLGRVVRLTQAELRDARDLLGRIREAARRLVQRQRRLAKELAPSSLAGALRLLLREERQRAEGQIRTVRALSPDAVLARGYGIPLWTSTRFGGRRPDLEAGGRFKLLLDDVVVAVVVEDVIPRPETGDSDDT